MKKRETQGGGNRGINLRQSFGTGWYSNITRNLCVCITLVKD